MLAILKVNALYTKGKYIIYHSKNSNCQMAHFTISKVIVTIACWLKSLHQVKWYILLFLLLIYYWYGISDQKMVRLIISKVMSTIVFKWKLIFWWNGIFYHSNWFIWYIGHEDGSFDNLNGKIYQERKPKSFSAVAGLVWSCQS